MKKLIIAEVNTFRAEVRAQARAAGQIRRQEKFVGIIYRLMQVVLIYIPIASQFLVVTKF